MSRRLTEQYPTPPARSSSKGRKSPCWRCGLVGFCLLTFGVSVEAAPRLDRHGDPLPDGATARLGTIRQRVASPHANLGATTQVVVSADGRTLVTAVAGRLVGHWDAVTGRMREHRLLPGKPTNRFWLSPDGQLLAVGEEEGVAVFDTETGARKRLLAVLADHVAFRPGGKALVTSEYVKVPCRIRLWNLTTGKDRLLVELPFGYVNAFAFRPDGKNLFAEVSDYTLRCWDINSGKERWQNRAGSRRQLVVSPDGRILCADAFEGPNLNLWDADTGRRISGGPSGRKPFITSPLAFAPDGRTVFLSDDKDVLLWDTAKSAVRNRLAGAGSCFTVAPDGKTLVSIAGSLLRRWDVKTGQPLYPYTADYGHTNAVPGVAFAPDGRGIATTGADGTLRFWDLTEQRSRTLLTDIPERIGGMYSTTPDGWRMVYSPSFLAVTPDDRGVLSDAGQGKLRLTDIHTGEEVRRFDARVEDKKTHIDTACLSADGRTLWALTYHRLDLGMGAAELKSKALVAWNVAAGRRLSTHAVRSVPGNNALAPDGGSVALEHGSVRDVASGNSRLEGEQRLSYPFAFSADSRLVVGIADREHWNAIFVYELLTGRPLIRVEAPVSQSSCFAFSRDDRLLIAAGRDALHVWEVSTGRRLLHLPAKGRSPDEALGAFAVCLAVEPDGRSVATGHEDGTVLLWDLAPAWRKLTPPAAAPTPAQLDACWSDLLKDDPRTAYAAIDRLSAAPAQALPLLRKHLRPVTIDSQWLERRLADLDSSNFAMREKASHELEMVAESVESQLRRAMAKGVSLELRRRLQAILEMPIPLVPRAETVRQLRAVIVLERIATPEADALLRELGRGEPAARLTIAARAALARLAAKSQR